MTLTYNKIKKIRLAIFLSLFFGIFLGFNNGNVLAVSDNTFVISSNNLNEGHVFCQNNCSDYNYLIITPNFDVNDNIRMSFTDGSSFYIYFNPSRMSSIVYELNSASASILQYNPNSTTTNFITGDRTITITLSASAPGGFVPEGSTTITENGTYDVSQYASVNVNVPVNVTEIIEDPISNDFQKVFFEIVKNIIPAFGILLVVWFGIDMLSSLIFGRGR